MPCATPVGTALAFGIGTDEGGLVTQSVSTTQKIDKKEARNNCGEVVSVVFYNRMTEVTIVGLGNPTATLLAGTALTVAGTFAAPFVSVGAFYIEELTNERANEDFVKSTIKATAWDLIP